MNIDLDKLEALARAATPGAWAYQEDSDAYTHIIRPVASPGWIIASATQTSKPEGEANGRWIAAASPAAILPLIELARRASASQISKDAGGMLNADELAALRRFDECAQDGEGYDVPKSMMRRLSEIGVVQRLSGAYYHMTEFGMRVLETPVHAAAAPSAEQALADMEARKDAAYYERNQVVAALAKCFPSGVARTAIEGWSEDWHGCVYIDLPTGQVSWHFHDSQAHLFADLPPYAGKWDGHDTPEKYRRVAALEGLAGAAAKTEQAPHNFMHVSGSLFRRCSRCDVIDTPTSVAAGCPSASAAGAGGEQARADVRDALRRCGANTDYHGKMLFSAAQFDHFVSMIRPGPSASAAGAGSEQALPEPKYASVMHIADEFGSGAVAYTQGELRAALAKQSGAHAAADDISQRAPSSTPAADRVQSDNVAAANAGGREAFERWARRVGYEVDTFKAEDETTYSATFANVAWEAWQAALAERVPATSAAAVPSPWPFCAHDGTCSCAKFHDNPEGCERRAERGVHPDRAPATSAGVQAKPTPPVGAGTPEAWAQYEAGRTAAVGAGEVVFRNDGQEPDWEAHGKAEDDALDAARWRFIVQDGKSISGRFTLVRADDSGRVDDLHGGEYARVIDAAIHARAAAKGTDGQGGAA